MGTIRRSVPQIRMQTPLITPFFETNPAGSEEARAIKNSPAVPMKTVEHSDFLCRVQVRPEPVVQNHNLRIIKEHHERLTRIMRSRRRGNPGDLDDGVSGLSEDDAVSRATADTISKLRRGGKAEMEAWLAHRYDLLEQHTVLRDALSRTRGQENEEIESALSALMEKHGEVINRGLRSKNNLASVLRDMDVNPEFDSDEGGDAGVASRILLEPQNPLQLAQAMLAQSGTKGFVEAMQRLRAGVASEATRTPADANPKMWLSLAAAGNFHMLQSTFAIAQKSRIDLSEAGVIPKKSVASATIAMLRLADGGEQNAPILMREIVGRRDLGRQLRSKAFQLIRQAVEMLPLRLWPYEKMTYRMALLARLKVLASDDAPGAARFMAIEDAPVELYLRKQLRVKKVQEGGE